MRPLKPMLATAWLAAVAASHAAAGSYPIAPTGQRACYDNAGRAISCTGPNSALGGQDAYFARTALRYRDNRDGTVTDLNTGLTWQQALGAKVRWSEAKEGAAALRLGGRSDWRLPSIKELFSLMDFSGTSPMPGRWGKPFLDAIFAFRYGDTSAGERPIDAQFWSADEYHGRTMGRNMTVFGVNFADGRIKGYPKLQGPRGEARMFVRYVRGNPSYGINDFKDNGNGTVTDRATGLMWMQADSGTLKAGPSGTGRMDWPQALAWSAQLTYAGYSDWRMPNAKELQSIVDYRRSPQATGGPAIDPVFTSTPIIDEGGKTNYGFYWTSTSHLDGHLPGSTAVYIAFGEALGFMRFPMSGNDVTLLDVHGAGAQRSDPKQGNPEDYPEGMGPQGDVRRIYNLVRLVRDVAPAAVYRK
ncbi:DUF1566 domain-containing protein [Accumulibacter sp.]|uniref:Lcl C-terminal domain-containing protein n=1 Tax=Accumulibacter sp. TaxID=2053492 RepID=UPI0025FB45BC|nr:DUF1566 domain-containing protein [Accumulibacter sp.]MCM8594096.1 DUF1566 domain-containing protein [Accumulibacter sp.]MCM8624505.1 DUF1566 domain-containing protein [Accumulibacter sp.]MDS4048239.1 DUF1566 domain-containing protein [Accumulibacter sp.]